MKGTCASFRQRAVKLPQLPAITVLIVIFMSMMIISINLNLSSKEVFGSFMTSYRDPNTRIIPEFLRFENSSTQIHESSSTRKNSTVLPTSTSITTTTTPTTTTTTTTNDTEGCMFQDVDAFDPKTMKLIIRHQPINCRGKLPVLVYIDDKNILRVNFTKVNSTVGKLDYCKCTRVELSDTNDSRLRDFKWSRKFLKEPLPLSDEDEQILVQCFLNKKIVGQMLKGRILEKPEVEERCETHYKRHAKEHSPLETMSVLIIGMDAMSKQNLARAMPKTRNFIIDKLHAKELNKFNKIAYSTYPNVIAMLTGNSEDDVSKVFNHKQYFDVIEDMFLWHHYQNAGYRTGMGFDVTWMSAFHYLKKGWKHPTFDYYSRGLKLAIKKAMPTKRDADGCVGETPELVLLQDYMVQMATLFNNTKSKPYFVYNFFTMLSHDYQNMASKGDEIYLNFFQELDKRKVTNNTVIIFFSDHGPRFGHFRDTFNGKIETNTPFVFFMFPPWFERKYPQVMETFQINQNRLTTFFDINKTLMDMLKFNGKSQKGHVDARAISLFDEIPMGRTCRDASIPMEYCNCQTLSKDNVTDEVKEDVSKRLMDAVVNRTNHIRDKCALLRLKSVKSVLTMRTGGEIVPNYQVTIMTEPGDGLYEGLMEYDNQTRIATLVGDIVRLNLYKGQDACVDTRQLKLYCFCQS